MAPGRAASKAGYSVPVDAHGVSGGTPAKAAACTTWTPTKCWEGVPLRGGTNPVTSPSGLAATPPYLCGSWFVVVAIVTSAPDRRCDASRPVRSTEHSVSPLTTRKVGSPTSGAARLGPPADPSTVVSHE